jgi:hypothetical protein
VTPHPLNPILSLLSLSNDQEQVIFDLNFNPFFLLKLSHPPMEISCFHP